MTLRSTRCPMGCLPSDRIVLTGRDRLHHGPGRFQIVRCACCGLLRTNPQPDAASIGSYYPEDYGPYQVEPAVSQRKAGKGFRLQTEAQQIPRLPAGRVLEVGCATGRFLDGLKADGWQTWGIELSATAASLATTKGHRVWNGQLADAADPEHPYDLICGWMVLEHVSDPLAALKRLRGWVKPGGWICLAVPDASSWEFRVFGSRWFALELPRHLSHFTPSTLRHCLTQAGWTPRRILWPRNSVNCLRSLATCAREGGWQRTGRMLDQIADRKRGRMIRALLALALGRGSGRMTVWAQNPR